MRKKVLHVINSLATGGAETLLVNSLSEGGMQEHADNTLVYFQGTSPIVDRLDKRVKVICLGYKGIFSLPRVMLKLRQIIRENKIDIVHSHLNPAGLYTYLACPKLVKQVHTLHTTYSEDKETPPIKRFLERQLYFSRKRCNIILLSDYIKADFLRSMQFRGKAFVLNNFVPDRFFRDAAKEYGEARTDLRLVAVGRIKSVKNYPYLVEVFTLLKDLEISLDIYAGGDKTELETLIRERGVKIRMMGQHLDLAEVLPAYDLFILPSRFEGFPLSVFEAMASGLPLLLTDLASLRSIVKGHALYFGLDNAKAVAGTLESILKRNIDLNSLAKHARDYADQTVRREFYIRNLLAIYEQL